MSALCTVRRWNACIFTIAFRKCVQEKQWKKRVNWILRSPHIFLCCKFIAFDANVWISFETISEWTRDICDSGDAMRCIVSILSFENNINNNKNNEMFKLSICIFGTLWNGIITQHIHTDSEVCSISVANSQMWRQGKNPQPCDRNHKKWR